MRKLCALRNLENTHTLVIQFGLSLLRLWHSAELLFVLLLKTLQYSVIRIPMPISV